MTYLNQFQNYFKTLTFFATLIFSQALYAHKTIGITQIVDHPSLNEIREGILEGLAQEGYREGKDLTVVFENAQGNPIIAAQIAQKLLQYSYKYNDKLPKY